MNIEQRKQQMQDILKDTVDYYREDPQGRRAVDVNGDCEYTTEDGRHCAIGRYMREEFLDTEWKENHGIGVRGLSSAVDYYLVHEVRGLDEDFWADLQNIHDTASNWLEWSQEQDGLRDYKFSDDGKTRYVAMQDKISRGEYDND